jgi:hypothetical protein
LAVTTSTVLAAGSAVASSWQHVQGTGYQGVAMPPADCREYLTEHIDAHGTPALESLWANPFGNDVLCSDFSHSWNTAVLYAGRAGMIYCMDLKTKEAACIYHQCHGGFVGAAIPYGYSQGYRLVRLEFRQCSASMQSGVFYSSWLCHSLLSTIAGGMQVWSKLVLDFPCSARLPLILCSLLQ